MNSETSRFFGKSPDELEREGSVVRAHGINAGDRVKTQWGTMWVEAIRRHYNGKFEYYIYETDREFNLIRKNIVARIVSSK